MLRIFVVSFSLLTAFASIANAQPGVLLLDNGPFMTGDGTQVCVDAPGGSNTSFPTGGTTAGINSYWAVNRVVDDFTIPNGQSWQLEQLRWRAYQFDTLYDAELGVAFVRVWATDPQLGGDPIWGDFETNRYINSTFSGVFRTAASTQTDCRRAIKNVDIDLSELPVLPAGQYWIEVGLDSAIEGGLFSPPTEPRLPTDNGLELNFSGIATIAMDGGTTEPLDFPFQLYGEMEPTPTRACVTGAGDCIDATLDDCIFVHEGTWNYLHSCAEVGACCDHADGTCEENVNPEDCLGSDRIFRVGESCGSIPNCGLSIGACCFPDSMPTTCQSFVNGQSCVAQGGSWHLGSCSSIDCENYCETAQTIADGETVFATFGYDTDGEVTPNECDNNPFIGHADAWFRYTSTLMNADGLIEFSLCQSSFDTTLQIYQVGVSTTCDDLRATAIATYCDNDGCGIAGGPSHLSVPADPGDEFLVRIGGYDGAQGGGRIRITPIENGIGACCSVAAACRVVDQSECSIQSEAFFPGVLCDNPAFDCPAVGACCFGLQGCENNFQNLCELEGGIFLGPDTNCGAPDDCDGDGETDQCAVAIWAFDCNANGVPDHCDISPGGADSDCDGNLIPDTCQQPARCCPGDVNGDAYVDGRDIQHFVEALFEASPFCFSREFCRRDVNGDFAFDMADVSAFVEALLVGEPCPVLIHVSSQVNRLNSEGQVVGVANQVFVLNEQGDLLYSYDQVSDAFTDSWGYRDGASDGEHVYFGWFGGVARHDADGGNGQQIIFGPVPETGGTWRALAFDPTGDGGNGSFWTQSFTSDLVETTLTGVLLNQFPNDLNLYGLAYNRDTGMLWGHHLVPPEFDPEMVEIDPATGLPTGVSFSSHYGVLGSSVNGLAQYGGASYDPRTQTLYGLIQGTPNDAVFHCDMAGNLLGPLQPNPRDDIILQTGTIRNLGVVISRP